MADLQQPDWRVPLVNTTTPRTVEDFQKEHATIAGLQAETRNRDAEARVRHVQATEAEQALAEQQLVRRVAQETGGAWDVMLPRLRQVAPGAAVKYEQELAKTRKEMAAAAKDEADMERQSIEYASSVLRSIRTPEQYAALRPRLAAINPDLAELLPEQYDPAALEQIQQLAIPAKDAAATNAKAAELFMQGKPMEAVGRILSVATDQEDWDEALGVARHYLPAQALAIFPREFTPEARAKAAELAMSVGERVDNKRADELQAATIANQQFDNETARAQLRVSQGQLGVAQGNLALRRQEVAQGGDGPLQAVIGPDGQPVLVARRDAIGKRPASGSGGASGGRPVTAGDAGRIADLDTSLDDLATVRSVLSGPGATGAASALEAYVPAVVTDLTGYGTAAKQRQATIDRVKQVIGKALEEGVLRKEDEAKYEKILPTIRDAPEIVTSKINGLEAAIRQRRQTKLEALADAGYDTSALERRAAQRATASTSAPPAPAPSASKAGTPPREWRYNLKTGKKEEVK